MTKIQSLKPEPTLYYDFMDCVEYIERTYDISCYDYLNSRADDEKPLQSFVEEVYQTYGINDTDVFTMSIDDFDDDWTREIAALFIKEFGNAINFIWYAE